MSRRPVPGQISRIAGAVELAAIVNQIARRPREGHQPARIVERVRVRRLRISGLDQVDALRRFHRQRRQRLIPRCQNAVLRVAFGPASAGEIGSVIRRNTPQVLVVVPVIPPRVAERAVALDGECGHAFRRIVAGEVIALRMIVFETDFGICFKRREPVARARSAVGSIAPGSAGRGTSRNRCPWRRRNCACRIRHRAAALRNCNRPRSDGPGPTWPSGWRHRFVAYFAAVVGSDRRAV